MFGLTVLNEMIKSQGCTQSQALSHTKLSPLVLFVENCIQFGVESVEHMPCVLQGFQSVHFAFKLYFAHRDDCLKQK